MVQLAMSRAFGGVYDNTKLMSKTRKQHIPVLPDTYSYTNMLTHHMLSVDCRNNKLIMILLTTIYSPKERHSMPADNDIMSGMP